MNEDLARAPIEIIERNGHDRAGAQTQLGEDHEDGIIPETHRRRSVAAIENLLNLLRRLECWQPCVAPAADRRHAVRQRTINTPSQMEVTQERAQTPAHRLAAVRSAIEGVALDYP